MYLLTVLTLYRKLKHFPSDSMTAEISSIKLQFIVFFLGFFCQAIYLTKEIISTKSTFVMACCKTVLILVSYLTPI